MRKQNKSDNKRHKVIPLEKFNNGVFYTLNINIDSDYSKKALPHAFADHDVKLILSKLSKQWVYYIYREISSVPNCRYHYHGFIYCIEGDNPRIDLYKELALLCENASIEIDTIEDYEKWREYASKQVDYWLECGDDYVPILTNFTKDVTAELEALVSITRMSKCENDSVNDSVNDNDNDEYNEYGEEYGGSECNSDDRKYD